MHLDESNLLDDEREYIGMMTSGAKFNDNEFKLIFGDMRLREMRANIPLRKHIAQIKIDEAQEKELSSRLQHEHLVKMIPHAINEMMALLKSGSEGTRKDLVKFILSPSIKALESKAALIGQAEAYYLQEAVHEYMNRSKDGDGSVEFPTLNYSLKDL